MSKMKAPVVVPTLTVTVNRETRQIQVKVDNWEGVSPGMLFGLELQIEKAIHQWHLSHTMVEQRKEEARVKNALVKQAGDGRVSPTQTEAV